MAKPKKTKIPAKKTARKTVRKPVVKKPKADSATPKHKKVAAKAKAPVKATAAPKARAKVPIVPAKAVKSDKARLLIRPRIRPEAFSLDEVLKIAKANSSRKHDPAVSPEVQAARAKEARIEARLKKASAPHYVQPASLADILGYNPAKQSGPNTDDVSKVEHKFQKYYKLLLQLRSHVQTGLSRHAEETLKRSSKEDTGDLSGYGQHMADAGTDTFDRDFALSLVSSEQEALSEIEAAIKRIHAGTYGVCELTGKPINRDRLTAVPFARFSVESQAEVERLKRRNNPRGGIFGEIGVEAKVSADDGED